MVNNKGTIFFKVKDMTTKQYCVSYNTNMIIYLNFVYGVHVATFSMVNCK